MSQKSIRLNMRLSPAEKQLLMQVAHCLQRTMSDTLRILLVEKAQELTLLPENHVIHKKESDEQ